MLRAKGVGVAKDEKGAAELLSRACEAGLPEACANHLLLTDKSGAGLKFTAEVLKLGSVSPALAAQVEGLSDLVIESPMFIGYRAVQFKYLPGLFEPDVEVRKLDLDDIEAIRASAASR